MQGKQQAVSLFLPNVLGYLRMIMAFVGLYYSSEQPTYAVVIWVVSALLDLLDGPLARFLNQTSQFGVVLDIVADNVLRSCVWVAVSGASSSTLYKMVACFFLCLEWLTMLSTQLHAASDGAHWKASRAKDPWLVQTFFANNFRNPLGCLGIYGLFSANLFCFGDCHAELYSNVPLFAVGKYVAWLGRGLSACIEIYFCVNYLVMVLERDVRQRQAKKR